MRALIFSAMIMAASAPAQAQPKSFTPPKIEIVNNKSIPLKEVWPKYDAAVSACSTDPAAKDPAGYMKCMNHHLAPSDLSVKLAGN
jgi:hypothetical protein